MTVAAAQARMLSLTMYKSDLEYRLMSLSNQEQTLSLQSANYAAAYASAGGTGSLENDPYMLQIQYMQKALEADKKLFLQTWNRLKNSSILTLKKTLS